MGQHTALENEPTRRSRRKIMIIGGIITAAIIGGSVAADAATTTPSTTTLCVRKDDHNPMKAYPFRAACVGSAYDTVRIQAGTPGPKGDPGAPGTNGTDGKNAIASITEVPAASLNQTVVLTHVGGSIRTGETDIASVTLDTGTYDVKALATFVRKQNTSSDPAFANIQTYGTFVAYTGDSINSDFSNDLTVGGVLIPKVNSTTLTIDPTANLVSTLHIAADGTVVHLAAFAYNDNSGSVGTTGQPGAGDFSVSLQSATFERLNVG